MNFRRKLARKLAMVTPVVVMVVLIIALVAIPAGALTHITAQPGGGTVLNSPDPVTIPTMLNYQGYLTDAGGNVGTLGTSDYGVVGYGTSGYWYEAPQAVLTVTILDYYRGLGNDPNVVELWDLVQAANDWLNGVIPPGFTAVITLEQLVQLANEWLAG